MNKTIKIAAFMLTATMTVASLTACNGSGSAVAKLDLNKMTLDEIIAQAKKEGDVQSVGMPDTWANWGETWTELSETYGITHTDADMSSAEELSLFESEKNNPTKDIGDVGQSFGPLAIEKDLVQPYKTSYWDSVPDWAKDENGNWMIGYYGTIAFLINTDTVKNPPKSWADLLDGDYKVSVGDVTKASASQNAVLAAAIANGGNESNIQPGVDFFAKLAEKNRLDLGDATMTRLEKGDVDVVITWDYLCLGNRDLIAANGGAVKYSVCIPSDGSVQSGYASVINKYAPHPAAAALAREYIFSDEGQVNLAKGYARPIRSDVVLPDDVKAKLLPDSEYANAKPIGDFDAWSKTTSTLPELWQNDVLAKQSN